MSQKVCYVVNRLTETSVAGTIATSLVDYTDFQVDVLSWFESDSFYGDDRIGTYCLEAPQSLTGINREIYREASGRLDNYDLVQVHHPHSGSIAKVIGHRLSVPMVAREGNVRSGYTRKGRVANGITNGLVDKVVPNSEAVLNSFTRWERILIDDDQIELIPNGVDLERIENARSKGWDIHEELGIPDNAIIVGTASVITEQKALDSLVRGIKLANRQSDRRIDLVIAGDGPLRPEIEQVVKQEQIQEQVHFLGMVEREMVYKLFTQIDIYAMPSRWEGFANAAVEALGAENACIFSDIDPFLTPYRNVAMFHPVDDISALADRLVDLAEDPEMRNQLAKRGRNLVKEKYTLRSVAERYASLYSEIT